MGGLFSGVTPAKRKSQLIIIWPCRLVDRLVSDDLFTIDHRPASSGIHHLRLI